MTVLYGLTAAVHAELTETRMARHTLFADDVLLVVVDRLARVRVQHFGVFHVLRLHCIRTEVQQISFAAFAIVFVPF
jgi:hypothetical protein